MDASFGGMASPADSDFTAESVEPSTLDRPGASHVRIESKEAHTHMDSTEHTVSAHHRTSTSGTDDVVLNVIDLMPAHVEHPLRQQHLHTNQAASTHRPSGGDTSSSEDTTDAVGSLQHRTAGRDQDIELVRAAIERDRTLKSQGAPAAAEADRAAASTARRARTQLLWQHGINYAMRWRGNARAVKAQMAVRPPAMAILWSFIACFVGIAIMAVFHYLAGFPQDHDALIGSFGALAVLLYGTLDAPFAQPRNVFVGHLIAAFVAVTINLIFHAATPDVHYEKVVWLAAALSVSVTLALMMVSRTVHPPAGAAALIGVLTDRTSYLYILYPVGFGVVVMFFIAMVINNIKRQYPAYWVRPKRAAAAAAASAAAVTVPPAPSSIAPDDASSAGGAGSALSTPFGTPSILLTQKTPLIKRP